MQVYTFHLPNAILKIQHAAEQFAAHEPELENELKPAPDPMIISMQNLHAMSDENH